MAALKPTLIRRHSRRAGLLLRVTVRYETWSSGCLKLISVSPPCHPASKLDLGFQRNSRIFCTQKGGGRVEVIATAEQLEVWRPYKSPCFPRGFATGTTALNFVCPMITVHACTTIILHVCTMITIHACTMTKVHACTVIIVYVCTLTTAHAFTLIVVYGCTICSVQRYPLHEYINRMIAMSNMNWHTAKILGECNNNLRESNPLPAIMCCMQQRSHQSSRPRENNARTAKYVQTRSPVHVCEIMVWGGLRLK